VIEYVFFHDAPLRRFLDFLAAEGVAAATQTFEDRVEVQVPDDLPETLSDAIDECYDRLVDEEGALTDAEQGEAGGEYGMAGITVHLADGETVYADVDPALLSRVLESISVEELTRIVDAVASAVERRESRTFCQRQREEGD